MKQNEFTRRTFLRHACCGTLGLAGSLALQPALAAEGKKTTLTPDQALAKLKKGNADSLVDKVRVKIDGAHYDLDDGKVDFFVECL